MDISQVKLAVEIGSALEQSLIDTLVGILKLHILTHQTYGHLLCGLVHLGEKLAPWAQVRLALRHNPDLAEHYLVKMLLMHQHGHLVDRACVTALHNCVGSHVAELGYLLPHRDGDIMLGAEHEHIGLYAEMLQLLHGVLRRLGLQLLGRRNERHICQMYAQTVVLKLPSELTHSLQKRQTLYIAHHATDLGDDKVKVARLAEGHHIALYLVSDMRYYLHGLAQIVATALLVDDTLIDTPRGDIVGTGGADIGKPLIVAQIEVGLMTVHRHITLSVLIRIERARIDIDVRVKLLYGDTITACLEQACERG